ncbi:MAG TPA: efflux RND transporter periplasmic adaptor subunit, partial [Chloroflexota bacterium]
IPAIALIILAAIIAVLMYNKKMRAAAVPTSEILRRVPVTVAPVSMRPLQDTLTLVGTVYANNDVNVISETQGRITKLHVAVGDYVRSGGILVQVDDELKRAAFSSAEVNFDRAKRDFDRYDALFKKKSITASQYEAARQTFKNAEAQFIVARRQLSDTRITSPISGWVTSRPVDLGAMVQPGTMVANVVDISTLKVKFSVAERDAFRLKVGDPVHVTTEVYPGTSFTGRLSSIAAKSDDAHAYPVEVALANSKEHPLKAGLFARVAFMSALSDTALSIPRAALMGSIKDPQVFVVKNDTARLRQIVVGDVVGDLLGIRQGLHEGETIVLNGQNNLKDGAGVTIVR